jgi:hypothetical protein
MKVFIGPYRYRWISGIHTNYMNNKYGYCEWNDNHNKFERFLEKFEDVLQGVYNATINKLLDKRTGQKIKVRIDYYDIWGMDETLAHIITPMLKLLKKKKHGSAYVDDADVPEHLQHKEAINDQDHPDHDDLIQKRWAWVLDEMLWAFEQKSRPGGWDADYYEFEDDPTATFGIKFTKTDREGSKKHQERMSNGFRLFGKYYEALWD